MNKKTSKMAPIVLGLALFSMFFGAGNLIFPPYLGLQCGTKWLLGFICFLIADIGLAFMAIAAMVGGDGSISGVTGKIGKIPSLILNTAVVVCIGPLLAIPRTAATTFETSIQPILPHASLLIFSIIFFGITIALTIRPSSVIDILGKVLTPLLVLILAIVIAAGIIHPLGEIQAPTTQYVVREGILNGYQAMDVLGALGFAIIIINSIKSQGITETKERNKFMLMACGLAGTLLLLVYGGLSYLGATAGTLYSIEDVSQAQLIVLLVQDLFGFTGVVLLGIVVGLACLTTAIGLTSATAEYFENITHGKVSYKTMVIIIGVFSMLVSNVGLTQIIGIASPILSVVYPTVVALIVLSLLKKWIKNPNVHKGAAIASLIVSIGTVLYGYGVNVPLVSSLPLFAEGLNWIIPTLIGGVIGSFFKSEDYKVLSEAAETTETEEKQRVERGA